MFPEECDEFGAAKEVLVHYRRSRVGVPLETVEAEIGELLLNIWQLADELGVDLIAAGQRTVGRRATRVLRLVTADGHGRAGNPLKAK